MQIAYRTGTITGMLTDSLGLLGCATIFLIFGTSAYNILLGFGFGGTLLALFMRVGGGIYTKAADVGADQLKIDGLPEDDPRNAATIADNVGDNVGDCAGMAADIFESYEVTIVAAMILGMATYGHKGVIYPLLVRGLGVLSSIISTYTVKAKEGDKPEKALRSVHRGFWIGSAISVVGFFVLAFWYLRFDQAYLLANPTAVGAFPNGDPTHLPMWVNFGVAGLDMRLAYACFVGIGLALALNKVTSFYTHTESSMIKHLAESCLTGHATNIIEGIAIGLESAAISAVVIGISIALSVFIFTNTPPLFVGLGVAMAGIGMLTLTGNTISMDVFGPVADNAQGIGAMIDLPKPAMEILDALDSVGNTTKAETKGIAIGSAVVAAMSLFSSVIAVLAVGSEEMIDKLTPVQFFTESGKITPATGIVFVGFLFGAAAPCLFTQALLRSVRRAASSIVTECRNQFTEEVRTRVKKPDYARVVTICTETAQAELIGPVLLAVCAPLGTGFILGPYALGGFLAGMILIGQILAVFMANAGGAWDNGKKIIEKGEHGGKGSLAHQAAITGDTVGDPLKDTAGPAVNPGLKVMNMVSLLALGLIVRYNAYLNGLWRKEGWIGVLVGLTCFAVVAVVTIKSHRTVKTVPAGELLPTSEPATEPAGV